MFRCLGLISAMLSVLVLPGSCQGLDEYQNNVQLDDLKQTYMLYWTHNSSDASMYFAVKVKTLGWAAFGFANKIGEMNGYDVVIGYVLPAKPSTELKDFHTTGHHAPPVDNIQSYQLTGSAEENGYTTLRFKRKIDTKDLEDIAIKTGPMYLVWAYCDVDNTQIKHKARGYKQVTLIHGAASTAHVARWALLLTTSSFAYFISKLSE